jgi:hypothetical protein
VQFCRCSRQGCKKTAGLKLLVAYAYENLPITQTNGVIIAVKDKKQSKWRFQDKKIRIVIP